MRCPTLSDLPPPPAGKTGWPWTDGTSALPAARPDGSTWPLISIVTPSYNQGQFIEETIRSVLLQGYPSLEYLIIDGGSGDQTVDIIKKYEPWLSCWVSERDRGQSHAINKGLQRSTGIVLSWLNSDDALLPNALATASLALQYPDEPVLIAGRAEYREISGSHSIWIVDRVPRNFSDVFSYFETYFPQPSVFFTRQALNLAGGLREDLHYTMDLDLWLRMAKRAQITLVEQHLSWMRQHTEAKTWRDTFRVIEEVEKVLQPYARQVAPEIAKRTFALARQHRSQAWVAVGRRSMEAGNRQSAWLAAYRAARVHACSMASRSWIGLVLRLTLPGPVRQLVFGGSGNISGRRGR